MSFINRWSRRKRELAAEKKPLPAEAKPGELPSLDNLTFDSDFGAILRANLEESVKRAALKKLLHDPRFNVMDGLDTYIDDYTQNDPIPEEMLKTLEHARSTLFGPEPQKAEPAESEKIAQDPAKPEADGDTRQDT